MRATWCTCASLWGIFLAAGLALPSQVGQAPDEFPARGGSTRNLPDGVYVIEEPRRTSEQLRALDEIMPEARFDMPARRWRHLPKTIQRLQEGGELHIVNLGDSIVNDTARSAWVIRLEERYPKCRIKMTTVVRGGTGCWWYREEGRIKDLVVPLKPDLVFLGGLSERGDVEAIAEVIRQLRKQTAAEILLATASFGPMDPNEPKSLERCQCSGYAPYGKELRALAEKERTGLVDMTRYWAEYVRLSGKPIDEFKRDSVHANSRGEQILGYVLDAFFAPGQDEAEP